MRCLLAAVPAAVGRVTHFVHSASPQRHEKDHALAVTDETWQSMRAVNVDAGFHLARELARTLIAARAPGSFLMLTSLHAGTPRNLPHYSSSKAALAMLVKELARTLGRFGIRVNALVPGAIAAGGFVADPSLARHIPLGRLGRSEDLVPMALAVLSNRLSAYVTGASIVVDGGLSLTNWFEPRCSTICERAGSSMPIYICNACGTSYPDASAPPRQCGICEDERQYVPPSGQAWTTPERLGRGHVNALAAFETGLFQIHTHPQFAIGQRALLLRTAEGNILWDCLALLDDATEALIRSLGGLRAIATSAPALLYVHAGLGAPL